MALSLIEVVNDALASLGEQPITDLKKENATSTSTLVRVKYPLVQRALLMEADWNCARKTRKLARLKYDAQGWDFAFRLPNDCLHVVQISIDGGHSYIDLNAYYNNNAGPKRSLFDRDGDVLLANVPEVWIKYTALIDVAEFDPFLAAAFSAQLAAELAYAVPASASLSQYLEQVAKKKLYKALSRNALDRNILKPEGEVINVRGYGRKYPRVDMSSEAG